jgi:hypothetical protein
MLPRSHREGHIPSNAALTSSILAAVTTMQITLHNPFHICSPST